jgi:hypothetical protein
LSKDIEEILKKMQNAECEDLPLIAKAGEKSGERSAGE